MSLRRLFAGLSPTVALALLGADVIPTIGPRARAADAPPALVYVGSATCASCHPGEMKLWEGSHHKAAMDHATDTSVLGDFSNATFAHFGVTSRFSKRDGKFYVETDGPDGKLAEFQIKYTFGIYPLQQYLIEFSNGRVQALGIAWDSRPSDKGGQRWFSLYPNEPIPHDDVLHWTKLNQNWNFMCAECHSTGLRKNYDAKTDTFATSWAEISVGCETCHGQGSAHVAWAEGARRTGRRRAAIATRRASSSASTSARTGHGRSIRRPAARPQARRRRRCERNSRPAASAMRGAPNLPRIGFRGDGSAIPMSSRRSLAVSISPTGRWRTKSTITARSSRARCSPKASPAATATTRTAPS